MLVVIVVVVVAEVVAACARVLEDSGHVETGGIIGPERQTKGGMAEATRWDVVAESIHMQSEEI